MTIQKINRLNFCETLTHFGYTVYAIDMSKQANVDTGCLIDSEKKHVYVNELLDDVERIKCVASALTYIIIQTFKEEDSMETKFYVNEETKTLRKVNAPYWIDYIELDRLDNFSLYQAIHSQGCCSNPIEEGFKEVTKDIFIIGKDIYKYRRETV